MKVADYILDFLVARGVDTVFGITGGFITPLFDAFHERGDITYICTQHEQAAAMAADGYSRFKGLGCAISTSGPGATNLITGIGCSWFDSIPVLFITGQVPTGEARGESKIRQRGFQETDICSIVKPITKYAKQVALRNVEYELNAAIWSATHGRPGPVLLDFPMDVLMSEMPDDLLHFYPPAETHADIPVDQIASLIVESKRPVIIYGQGARRARGELIQFVEATGIPCLPSWAALDLIPHNHPLFVSTFGVYGSRTGNFAVQNADLIIAIGTRLDGRMTGKSFAPKAKRVIIDVDIHEAQKNAPDVMVIADAPDFLRAMNSTEFIPAPLVDAWRERIAAWKRRYPIADSPAMNIDPLAFIRKLCELVSDDAIIIPDSGANLSWTQQVWEIRGTQRLFSDYGFSCMGYSLPAAMGASMATGRPVTCIIGDGGMQMNIQELQTLKNYQIPVKVFILNNRGYGMIKQFQDELYQGRYIASDDPVPDFQRIAQAYVLPNFRIPNMIVADWMIAETLRLGGPVIVDVEIDPEARIFPKVCFGNALDNQSPLLSPEERAENMTD